MLISVKAGIKHLQDKLQPVVDEVGRELRQSVGIHVRRCDGVSTPDMTIVFTVAILRRAAMNWTQVTAHGVSSGMILRKRTPYDICIGMSQPV